MLTSDVEDNRLLLGLILEATASPAVSTRFKKLFPPAKQEELAGKSQILIEKLLREQLRSSKFMGEDVREGFFLRNESLHAMFIIKVKKRSGPTVAKILTLKKGNELLHEIFKDEDEISW